MCCASSRLKGEGLNLTNVFSFNQRPAKENGCLQVLWNTLAWAGFIIAALSSVRESQASEIFSCRAEGGGIGWWREGASLCFFIAMRFLDSVTIFFLWKQWFWLPVAAKIVTAFRPWSWWKLGKAWCFAEPVGDGGLKIKGNQITKVVYSLW